MSAGEQSTDQELVGRAKRGDNAAFGELWRRHEPHVLRLCHRYLDSRRDPGSDPEDLALDTFIRALHYLQRYEDQSEGGASFRAWLLAIARRLCLTSLRADRRRQGWTTEHEEELACRPDGSLRLDRLVEQRDVLRRTAQEINALPRPYRAAFKLFLEECSHREIAEQLGISADAAAKRIQRARHLLQPRLERLLSPHGPDVRAGRTPVRTQGMLSAVERALTAVVSDNRIVELRLPGGGWMQLCLRVDSAWAAREHEIPDQQARLRRHPDDWQRRLELADTCFHSGRWKEARAEYRRVLDLNPACLPASLRLGHMLFREENPSESAAVFRAALEQDPPAPAAARLEAHLRLAEGRSAEAVEAFRRAVALEPREKAAYFGLFEALGQLSRYEEQLEVLETVRKIDPRDVRGYAAVYTPCARLVRFDVARPLLERALALDPNDIHAVRLLFQVRMNLKLLDAETQALAERLVHLAPEFVGSWGELAWFYAETGRDEESLAILQRFLKDHPDNAEAHASLAWRFHYLKRRSDELRHARAAYRLEPQNSHVCWTMLAACHGGPAGKEAVSVAVEVAARFPMDAFMQVTVAHTLASHGLVGEALTRARAAIELSPASPYGHLAHAELCCAAGRWEEAAAGYQQVMELSGPRRAGVDGYARCLRELGDPRADALFAEAVSRADPLHAGLIYEKWGRREEAVAALEWSLRQRPLATHHRRAAEEALRRLQPGRHAAAPESGPQTGERAAPRRRRAPTAAANP